MFQVSRLTYQIDSKIILDNISFNIKKGDWVSVIGPNGAGKTTLLKCISNLLEFSGEVKFINNSLLEYNKKKFFRQVGVLFQDFNNDSSILVSDFIKYSFYPFENEFSEKEIGDFFDEITTQLKIENLLSQKINSLSGGELQKVKLASCLIKKPKILLLDEIFNHLDPRVQGDIEEILQFFHRNGGTVFLITHDLNKAFLYCTKVLCLKNGNIVYDGTASGLIEGNQLNIIYDKKFKIIKDNGLNYII